MIYKIILGVAIFFVIAFAILFRNNYRIEKKTNGGLNAEMISIAFIVVFSVIDWFVYGHNFANIWLIRPADGHFDPEASTLCIVISILPPAIVAGLGYFINWVYIMIRAGYQTDKYISDTLKKGK